MHNQKNRRKEIFWRTVIYLVMTMAVFVLAGLSLFLVLGYNLDNKGRAEQGGLIQYRSFPDGASVRLDGILQSANTPSKSTANAGRHNVSFERKDYRSWNKDVTLNRGELLWLNALLVPKSITTNEVHQFDGVSSFVASPDKKWIAVIEKANEPSLKIIDIRDEKKPRISTLKIPDEITKTATPEDIFTIAEWDFGSRYLLVKHTSGQSTEWLRLDRSDESNAENISRNLKLSISEAHFAGTSGNLFFALSDATLRKLNIDQNTSSTPISEDVKEFQLYKDNRIALVSVKDDEQVVSVYKDGDKRPTEVTRFKGVEPSVDVALSSYFEDDYIAYSRGDEAHIIKNPFDSPRSVATVKLDPAISWLYFSNNGQFLIAQYGSKLISYDLERNLSSLFSIPGDPVYTGTKHLEWLDDFHLWSDSGGTLSIFEFDGTNGEVIGNITQGFDVTLSNNGKRLFSLGVNESTKKPVLQSSVMVLE